MHISYWNQNDFICIPIVHKMLLGLPKAPPNASKYFSTSSTKFANHELILETLLNTKLQFKKKCQFVPSLKTTNYVGLLVEGGEHNVKCYQRIGCPFNQQNTSTSKSPLQDPIYTFLNEPNYQMVLGLSLQMPLINISCQSICHWSILEAHIVFILKQEIIWDLRNILATSFGLLSFCMYSWSYDKKKDLKRKSKKGKPMCFTLTCELCSLSHDLVSGLEFEDPSHWASV